MRTSALTRVKRPSALTRSKRRVARELLAGAPLLVGEGVRSWMDRPNTEDTRQRLRCALCAIAERLGYCDAELERMLRYVRKGHHDGQWTLQFTRFDFREGR